MESHAAISGKIKTKIMQQELLRGKETKKHVHS